MQTPPVHPPAAKARMRNTNISAHSKGNGNPKTLGVQKCHRRRNWQSIESTITKSGFSRHALNRINLFKIKLNVLYRFIDLSPNNKRTLYLSLIKSVLVYPPIVLHTVSKTQAIKMQIVQNKQQEY